MANVSNTAKRAGGRAADAGREVADSKTFDVLVTVGLIAYGVVHLLVAWIALQVAWGGDNQEASQRGAMQEMGSTGIGRVLLWVTAVGLFALVLWQLFEAIAGHRDQREDRKRLIKRLGSAGKAVIYGLLGVSAVSTATGSSSSGESSEKTLTASLMTSGAGRVLVIAIGVGVVVAGARLAYRGLKKKFAKELEGSVSRGVIRLGQVGFIAKGVALAIVGVLFVVAAITFDPDKAGGLDTALRTLRAQPFGAVLLTLMALGIASFGAYCFAWSRHAKTG